MNVRFGTFPIPSQNTVRGGDNGDMESVEGQVARVGARHLTVAGASPADPWSGVDSGDEYSADGFYVRSVNKHDHTAQTRVPMHPEVYAEINRLVASGELGGTPINSYQAFMRDSAVHNMHRIARVLNNPDMARFAEMQRRLARADALADEVEALRKMVADANERIEHAIKIQDRSYLEQMLELYEPMAERVRDPYGSELEKMLSDARQWLRVKVNS